MTPPPNSLPLLAAYFAAGMVTGTAYFGSLWWSTRRFAVGGRIAPVIALSAARLALLTSLLVLASLRGAPPLLLLALGVFVARFAIMRGPRAIAS